ncbi:hypothetical protein [Moheibacter sediminis]|uniref:Uncharacterized protein n=1 Tax=Moheibacter sediminis TaxID=1434700 RepID=A0A1W1ZAD4_9FLAO|nr:hypothetical protein [Moheibacter sediminis]SMC45367.1 hypothetical protein SAMN06296427_102314 [Moheibacter sediminis]
MKKFFKSLLFSFIVFILILIYAVIHNQFTYAISPEIFTELFFIRFGFVEYGTDTPRLSASIIGIWAILFIAFLISTLYFVATLLLKPKFKIVIRAIQIHLITTIVIGLTGLLFGYVFWDNSVFPNHIPIDVINYKNYSAGMHMHGFSHTGGFIGIIFSFIYLYKNRNSNS